MFSTHPTRDPGIIFSPKPSKKHTPELTLKIDNLKPRKELQTDKNRLPTGSPNPLKICGNPTLDPKLSPLVSQWTPRSPTWWPKVQNASLRIVKWSLKNQKYCPTNQHQPTNNLTAFGGHVARLHSLSFVFLNLASLHSHPSYPSVLHPCIYILIWLYPVGCIMYPVVSSHTRGWIVRQPTDLSPPPVRIVPGQPNNQTDNKSAANQQINQQANHQLTSNH